MNVNLLDYVATNKELCLDDLVWMSVESISKTKWNLMNYNHYLIKLNVVSYRGKTKIRENTCFILT